MSELTGDHIEFSTIPTGRIDLPTPNDGSAVEVDAAQVRTFVQGLLNGTPPSTVDSGGTPDRTVVVRKLAQHETETPINAGGCPASTEREPGAPATG